MPTVASAWGVASGEWGVDSILKLQNNYMAKVVLSRPEVAAKYECNVEVDHFVNCLGYSGRLSKINLKGAESLVKSKVGYLVEKAAAKPGADKPKTEPSK